MSKTRSKEMLAECVGTFILVLFGVGSVAVSVWTGALSLWPVSIMFAMGVTFGVYASAKVSGGHINPAVTLTMAVYRDFPWHEVPGYLVAQLVGTILAAGAFYYFYADIATAFDASQSLVRGKEGSQLSAMGFGTYAPNPAIIGTTPESMSQVSNFKRFLSEAFATAILVFGVFFLTDKENSSDPAANLAPLFIGLLVAALVAYEAPISMIAMNSARDLGPRIVSWLVGWGDMAFPGPKGGWWIPSVAPIVGGLIAGALYQGVYRRVFVSSPAIATAEGSDSNAASLRRAGTHAESALGYMMVQMSEPSQADQGKYLSEQLTADVVRAWLESAAEKLKENRIWLTELDAPIGDADHGNNMDRGFRAVVDSLPEGDDIGATLKATAMALIAKVGGAAGPLYGTMFLQSSKPLVGQSTMTAMQVNQLLDDCVAGVMLRGRAQAGEKTMLDALVPARDAYRQSHSEGGSIVDALEAAAAAAGSGMKATVPMIARKGRASYLGERSVGHQDPGASSSYLMLQSLAEAARQRTRT